MRMRVCIEILGDFPRWRTGKLYSSGWCDMAPWRNTKGPRQRERARQKRLVLAMRSPRPPCGQTERATRELARRLPFAVTCLDSATVATDAPHQPSRLAAFFDQCPPVLVKERVWEEASASPREFVLRRFGSNLRLGLRRRGCPSTVVRPSLLRRAGRR